MTIKRGMIFCAGLGTRMLPVTRKTPKPIVPVLNIANLLHNVALLKRSGIEEIILNTHHLGKEIETFLGDGSRWKVRFTYSNEQTLLGTGGGLKKAEWFFKGEPFVLCNCDFVTNVDLNPIIEKHLASRATATMVLYDDPARQVKYSKVGIDIKGRLCSLRAERTGPVAREGIFTGIHVLNSDVFSFLKEEPSGINEVFYPAMMRERPNDIFGQFADGAYWYDTGDIEAFWYSSMKLLEDLNSPASVLRELLAHADYAEQSRGVWIAKGERFPANITINGPAVIGKNVQLEKGTTLGPSVVIGDNVQVAKDSTLVKSVVLPESKILGSIDGAVFYGDSALQFKK